MQLHARREGTHLLLQGGKGSPLFGMPVGDEIELLLCGGLPSKGAGSLFQRVQQIRVAVRLGDLFDALGGKIMLGGRLIGAKGGRDRNRRSRGQTFHHRAGGLAGKRETGALPFGRAHARGVVDHDRSRDFRPRHSAQSFHHRTRDGESEQGDQETTQEEQDQILQPHPALILLHAHIQKTHRRPAHLAKSSPVQKVNDDRDRNREDPEEKGLIEKVHQPPVAFLKDR